MGMGAPLLASGKGWLRSVFLNVVLILMRAVVLCREPIEHLQERTAHRVPLRFAEAKTK
jgi:hypothetical protein